MVAKLPAFCDTTTKMPELVSLISEFAGTDVDWNNLAHPASLDTRRNMSAKHLFSSLNAKKIRTVNDEVIAIEGLIARLPKWQQERQRVRLSKALKTRRSAPRNKVKRRLERLLGLRTPAKPS